MNNIIELKKVKKVYKDITTVDIEKITVREGEIYGFLGPNGAGKTTTMKMKGTRTRTKNPQNNRIGMRLTDIFASSR